MRFKTLYIFLLFPYFAVGQNDFQSFLQSVEDQNRMLISARRLAEVERLEARTGIYLPNPEISYDYLSGVSDGYSEMVVSQSFDFPASYVHMKRIAEISDKQAGINYEQLKLEILTKAAQCYTQLVSINRQLKLLKKANHMIIRLLSNTERKLAVGEINILELNRIRSELAKNRVDLQALETRKQTSGLKIAELNGGNRFEIVDTLYFRKQIQMDSDTLVQAIVMSHPLKDYWKGELEKTKREIKLKRTLFLPSFKVGYRQDMASEETYRGIHLGIDIPLMEHKNEVRLAKAQQGFIQEEINSKELSLNNKLAQKLLRYKASMESLSQLEQVINASDTPNLLMQAYDSGEISYIEFFSEYLNYLDLQLLSEDLREEVILHELEFYILGN